MINTIPEQAKTRVAFLTQSAQLAGAEIWLLRMVSQVNSITPVVIVGENGPLIRELKSMGVRTQVLPLSTRVKHVRNNSRWMLWRVPVLFAGTAAYSWKLWRLLRREKLDLVYSISAKYHIIGTVAARIAHVPAIVHLHDAVGHSSQSTLLRHAVRILANSIVANSAFTASSLRSTREVTVQSPPIPWPVRVGPAYTVPPRRIGVLSRLSPWKGQALAIRALAKLREERPELELSLVLAGGTFFPGDVAFARELATLVEQLGLKRQVHFLGHVSDIAHLYDDIDVLLHTALTPEPFGQVIVEAMSRDVIVIAPNAGGPLEVIKDRESGFLYQQASLDDLTRTLLEVIDLRPSQVEHMKLVARSQARNYELPRAVAAMESFVHASLAKRTSCVSRK